MGGGPVGGGSEGVGAGESPGGGPVLGACADADGGCGGCRGAETEPLLAVPSAACRSALPSSVSRSPAASVFHEGEGSGGSSSSSES